MSAFHHPGATQKDPQPDDAICRPQPSTVDPERIAFVRSLTSRMESAGGGFSWLRLGDGELRYMKLVQSGKPVTQLPPVSDHPSAVERCVGGPGLAAGDYERLVQAYLRADFVDGYGHQATNQRLLPTVDLPPRLAAGGDTTSATSGILQEWLMFEFPGYLSRHVCLVCGAEGPLLEQLVADPAYLALAEPVLPVPGNLRFHHPPDHSHGLSAILNRLKGELATSLKTSGADTLLLSLGGAAKILAAELAAEHGVTVIDWGSSLRALTYAGSDGQSTWRASHYPFLFRVPYALHMKALEAAHPGRRPAFYLAKAYCQLALELQLLEPLNTHPSDLTDTRSLDRSPANIRRFCRAEADFMRLHGHLRFKDEECTRLTREFGHWKRYRGIGLSGKIYRSLLTARKLLTRS